MRRFAKLFETEEHGQILVKLDTSDDGLEVRFYFDPNIEGLNICSVAVEGEETEEGWRVMQSVFDRQDAESASAVVAGVKKEYAAMFAIEPE